MPIFATPKKKTHLSKTKVHVHPSVQPPCLVVLIRAMDQRLKRLCMI